MSYFNKTLQFRLNMQSIKNTRTKKVIFGHGAGYTEKFSSEMKVDSSKLVCLLKTMYFCTQCSFNIEGLNNNRWIIVILLKLIIYTNHVMFKCINYAVDFQYLTDFEYFSIMVLFMHLYPIMWRIAFVPSLI